jgi:hypothetical protein
MNGWSVDGNQISSFVHPKKVKGSRNVIQEQGKWIHVDKLLK